MKFLHLIKSVVFKTAFYYQKFQLVVLSLFVVGIADYFFLYEIFISLSPFLLELGPVIVIILSVIIIRGVIKYIQRKMKENKHLVLL